MCRWRGRRHEGSPGQINTDTHLQAVDLALQPGQISLHHLWIVHGSNTNRSDIPRIGIAIRYVATRVRQDGAGKPIAMLVRGQDAFGHFQLVDRPVRNDAMAGTGRHAQLLQRVHAALTRARGEALSRSVSSSSWTESLSATL